MNVNLSSLSSSCGSTRTSQTQRTGPTDAEKAKMFADMDSDSDGSVSKSEFEAFKPPEAPSQFNVQRSTSQLAQQSGHGGPGGPGGAGGDPIQSLDSDSDGSVSSDEFGLDSASDEVKKLYAAIDSDSATTSISSTGTRSSQRPDASEMIRMIAARYAEMQSSTSTESLSLTA
ncbi:hypothetical protein [Sphaerotilus sp.]|uniref:hypothetical protein n=1 Tax=Sphaerotilus sp. TaxID=2093942 RepID=UPI00286D8375|nr:hypothetical protein [Sphaerotilus sp.]